VKSQARTIDQPSVQDQAADFHDSPRMRHQEPGYYARFSIGKQGIAGRKKEILAWRQMFYPLNAALPCGLASKGLALDLEDPHKYPD
jgi:hypothetical protein